MNRSNLNKLSEKIIGSAIEVHRTLGPGLLESTYRKCLVYELKAKKLTIEEEKTLPVVYKDIQLESAYRIDIVVNQSIIVELKHVETLLDVHKAQVLTYLKLGAYPLGLLINFNVKLLKNGIKRFVM